MRVFSVDTKSNTDSVDFLLFIITNSTVTFFLHWPLKVTFYLCNPMLLFIQGAEYILFFHFNSQKMEFNMK